MSETRGWGRRCWVGRPPPPPAVSLQAHLLPLGFPLSRLWIQGRLVSASPPLLPGLSFPEEVIKVAQHYCHPPGGSGSESRTAAGTGRRLACDAGQASHLVWRRRNCLPGIFRHKPVTSGGLGWATGKEHPYILFRILGVHFSPGDKILGFSSNSQPHFITPGLNVLFLGGI